MNEQAKYVLLHIVVPIIGNVIGALLCTSPIQAVIGIRKKGSLGDVNPLPYPLTFINSAAWVGYAFVTENIWVVPSNSWGALCGLFFTFTAFGAATTKVRDMLSGMVIGAIFVFCLMGTLSALVLPQAASIKMWGIYCDILNVAFGEGLCGGAVCHPCQSDLYDELVAGPCLLGWGSMVYYASPLSTMREVVRTKDAASIYLPLAIMSTINGMTWLIYGLAIADVMIWPIACCGATLGVFQMVIKLIYHGPPKPIPGFGKGDRKYDDAVHHEIDLSELGLLATSDGPIFVRSDAPRNNDGEPPLRKIAVGHSNDGADHGDVFHLRRLPSRGSSTSLSTVKLEKAGSTHLRRLPSRVSSSSLLPNKLEKAGSAGLRRLPSATPSSTSPAGLVLEHAGSTQLEAQREDSETGGLLAAHGESDAVIEGAHVVMEVRQLSKELR